MTPEQEASLTRGGDCFSHYHSEDRIPTQDFLHGLQTITRRTPLTANYTVTPSDDFLIVDTSGGNVIITLPRAVSGVEVEILKRYAANTVIILPEGTDTILTSTGATITSGNAAIRFKAFDTDWRPI